MKPAIQRGIIAAAVLLVLALVNGAIYSKERIRSSGERILLELAPVDPRSLMQGDYMILRFTLAEHIKPGPGDRVPLVLDANGVATLDPANNPASPRIRYRWRNGWVWLGTNAYFFEEGRAVRFGTARYGEFRLDRKSGEAVLVGLRDKDFKAL
jgi:uncharacterized membrane-anchored protein